MTLVKQEQLEEFGPFLIAIFVGVVGILAFLIFGAKKRPKKVLPLSDYELFPLVRKEMLSHDTVRFTFGLPSADHIIGLPIGQHISFKFKDQETNKDIIRSYTPVTDNTVMGEISFVIKVYEPLPPKFPNGGSMSQYVNNLQIGDRMYMKGPKGHVHWLNRGNGTFDVKPLGKPMEHRKCVVLGLIAGGTGITPMLQILNAILNYPCDHSIKQIKLIYANQTENDILVRDELEQLQAKYPTRFQLWYTIDRIEEANNDNSSKPSWKYSIGFIDKNMIKEHLSFDDVGQSDVQYFMCGPPPMIKFACLPNLKELGYTEKNWVVF